MIHIENIGPHRFLGWVHTTTDSVDIFPIGVLGQERFNYRLGNQTGADTRGIDLYVNMAGGARRSVDPADWAKESLADSTFLQWPADPIKWLGGFPQINGQPMQIITIGMDGSALAAHLSYRIPHTIFAAMLWVRWYPGEPWARGQIGIVASDPRLASLEDDIPDIRLTWGDSVVSIPGLPENASIATELRAADGQGRGLPLQFTWWRHMTSGDEMASARALPGVVATGIKKLLPDGNPIYPSSFDPALWAQQHYHEAVRRLHTWEPATCGPNAASGDAGSHEDTVFTGGEPLLPGGTSALIPALYGAYKMLARPCHHLRPDGTLHGREVWEQGKLPIMWDGRPWHDNLANVIDRRGKLAGIGKEQTSGNWWGPDVEHSFNHRLFAVARLTGDPLVQWMLEAQAALHPKVWTTTPGWSTTQTYAARAVGWFFIRVVGLHRELANRQLAESTKQHAIEYWNLVVRPAYASKADDIWDVRVNDPRLGPGAWWICWQQAVAAYGLDLAGAYFNIPEMRAMALRGAKRVVSDAWVKVGSRWQSAAQRPVVGLNDAEFVPSYLQARRYVYEDAGIPLPEGEGETDTPPPQSDEGFNYYGMPLAVACVLRHEPQHVKARAIWTQLASELSNVKQARWMAPEVQ